MLPCAYLLVAHGSRRPQANAEVAKLAPLLAQRLQAPVEVAFLEIATPACEETIDRLLAAGYQHIKIVPYLLNTGVHLMNDIPILVKKKSLAYPECRLEILESLGNHPAILEVLVQICQRSS